MGSYMSHTGLSRPTTNKQQRLGNRIKNSFARYIKNDSQLRVNTRGTGSCSTTCNKNINTNNDKIRAK